MMKSNATMMPWTSRRSQTIEPSMLFFVEEDDRTTGKVDKGTGKTRGKNGKTEKCAENR